MELPTRRRSWHLWLLAIVLTLASAVYQKRTGPTYAVHGRVTLGTDAVAFKLPRSHAGDGDAEIQVPVPDSTVTGTLNFRRYRSHDDWSSEPLVRDGDQLVARIPHQPPAGKVMYRVLLRRGDAEPVPLTADPVIIRFRGDVPAGVLIPHIILMFSAMLLSTRTGLEALLRRPGLRQLTLWTAIFLFLGGMIGGPLVQKYAFDAYWTGWPRGTDLTDNKTAVAVIFWLIALWRIRRKPQARAWPLIAAVVTFAIFLIPHSAQGSELDFTKLPASGA